MAAHYPTVRGVGAFQGSAGSITHTIGGATVPDVDDLILIFLGSANQAFTPVSGYLEVPSSPQSAGTAAAAGAVRLTIFYKFSNGTETTYVTGDSGNHNTVASMIIRGVDKVNPFNDNAGNTAAAPGGVAPFIITCPAVTTTVPECMIINAIVTDYDANSTAVFSNPTNANLTDITEHIDGSTNQQQGGGIGVFTGLKDTVGSTGTTSVTQIASEETARITLALSPLRRRISVT
jgi:hypothetical protein